MALRLLCAAAVASSASAVGSQTEMTANPIRRVVNLLQKMQKKVTEEGERDKTLMEKYMCYCKNGKGDLEKSIQDAETKMPQVTSALSEAKAKKDQLQSDLKSHQSDRADAKEALAKATALHEKEAATFATEIAETQTNVAGLVKATAAISKGVSGFLQTSGAAVLRRLTVDVDLDNADRDLLSSFLSVGQSDSDSAPATSEILGILKQMSDTMAATLQDLKKSQGEAKVAFEALSSAKEKEISVNTHMVEEKTARLGQTGVDIENLKADLEDTSASYADDKVFVQNLEKNCKTKQEEWDAVQKTRANELVALADTIKILNDDSALDLFKSTLPSTSLLQLQVQAQQTRKQALQVLKSRSRHAAADPRLDFLMLAIRGKKVSFEKVLSMVDEMRQVLKNEQTDDDAKKGYCEAKIDESEDEQKELELTISDLGKTVDETKSSIEVLSREINALTIGIKALDKSVAEATETRKDENAEYKKTMASDTAAKELLKMAKDRLMKFYSPAAATATSFVQVKLHARSSEDEAPPPPPEAVQAYQKKGEESAGVLQMVTMLISDLDTETTQMEVEEKDSQANYEKFMADSAKKRTIDSKSLEDKEGMKAEAEALLQRAHMESKSKKKEAYANSKVIRDLHQECDWLLSNFKVRQEARAGELDSLAKAKAVLSGADYSFVQAGSRHRSFLAGRQ